MTTKVKNTKLQFGHAGGHVRETAGAAFHAWMDWDGTGPEPTVEFEVNYEPHQNSDLTRMWAGLALHRHHAGAAV